MLRGLEREKTPFFKSSALLFCVTSFDHRLHFVAGITIVHSDRANVSYFISARLLRKRSQDSSFSIQSEKFHGVVSQDLHLCLFIQAQFIESLQPLVGF